jgi:hypothetical protein
MKNRILILLLVCMCMQGAFNTLNAQDSLWNRTQVEVGFGFVLPQFYRGAELMRSYELRQNGLSYFQDADGNHRAVGNYGRSSGAALYIGYYKPVKFAKGLLLGALVRNSQTGSLPETGGYDEGYFFNFITASLAAKYYPRQNDRWYVKADVGLGAVLTKDRFRNQANEQNFFHQFGIGQALGVETGFSFPLSKNKPTVLELKTGYQWLNTRVEVNGIGDDPWQFGALFFGTSVNF